jgi:hypothetical protein
LLGIALPIASHAFSQGYVLWSFQGGGSGDVFGTSVAGAGDVDGDGSADLLIGAPQNCLFGGFGGPGQGYARVYSGSSGQAIHTLGVPSGGVSPAHFGHSVSSLGGDADGDGFDDFIIGAPYACTPPPFPCAGGQAYLFSGVSGGILLTVSGPAFPELLGAATAGVGDVSVPPDGVPDFIIGSPYFGGAIGLVFLLSLTGMTGWSFSGMGTSDAFGWSVSGIGDVDMNGVPDVVVGAPGAGYVSVLSGTGVATVLTLTGGATDGFGRSVAGVGDVGSSPDGIPDVLVGAPQASPGGIPGAGEARVFSGSGGGLLFALSGTQPQDALGSSVDGIGDLNADGVPDLIVGAPQGGCAGVGPGYVLLVSGATGSTISTLTGASAGDRFGAAVADAGDVDADGVSDVLIGAPGGAPGGLADAGYASAYSLVGISPGSNTFGFGCAGSGGIVPRIRTFGGPADASGGGNPGFGIFLSKALGGTPAVLVMGLSVLSPALNLGTFGSPGCSLYVSPDVTIPTSTSGAGPGVGKALVPLPVPADPALAGIALFFQWYVIDPGPAVVPGAVSEAWLLLVL